MSSKPKNKVTIGSRSDERLTREFFLAAMKERDVTTMYDALALIYELRANGVGFARTDDVRAWFSIANGRGGRFELSAKALTRRGRGGAAEVGAIDRAGAWRPSAIEGNA